MLKNVKGIGPKTIKLLEKLNITTEEELLNYYPYKYKLYHPNELTDTEEEQLINGTISSLPKTYYLKRNLNKLTFTLTTQNKLINITIFNRAFIKPQLTLNKNISIIGKYNIKTNNFIATDIKLSPITKDTVEPIYHTTQGLSQTTIRKIILNQLETTQRINTTIPKEITTKYKLIDKKQALNEIHNPTSTNELKQSKLMLKYEELFEYTLKINYLKLLKDKNKKTPKKINQNKINEIIKTLPYKLTPSQQEAVEDIKKDLESSNIMNRLILGDVGSGKTIIAFLALYMNHLSGYQSVLMAPTEILAIQHYNNIKQILPNLNVSLLTSSTKNETKEQIKQKLKTNEIDIIISTHSILNKEIEFKNLGLVITDEQHRFGVNQRNILQNKGTNVDALYMSATPIPRTLALTLFNDMDITEIKTKPLNRKPKITKLYQTNQIKEVLYQMIEELKQNHQIYVISPQIEDNEEIPTLSSVKLLYNKLNIALNNKVPIDILHGKLKNNEKDQIMKNFKDNKTKILISTTIIEIGVDVSNATMIVIFNAERFGLATLHQLRGRIGRNNYQSKCLLISDYDTPRLKILEESDDGFYIAEKDFEIRGSGDIFGIKQSGEITFKIANLKEDYKILKQCSEDSLEFLKNYIDELENYPEQKRIISSIQQLN